MKILFIIKKKEPQELLNELIKTDNLEEVIKVLSGVRDRSTFVNVINELLNRLSEERQARLHLERKINVQKVGLL